MSGYIVRIFESELMCVVHETSLHQEIETGGSLFGLWTDAGNPTVLLASRPGPRAIRQVTQFEQDVTTHRLIEQILVERFGAQSVGLWHSHHKLGLHELSGGDIRRTMGFARRTERARFCDLLCYFGEGSRRSSSVTVKPYVYVNAAKGQRVPTSVVVLPGMSPVRAALHARSLPPDVATELWSALAPSPDHWQAEWRLARSIELADREDEDAQVHSGRGIWPFRKGRSDASGDAKPEGTAEPQDGEGTPRSDEPGKSEPEMVESAGPVAAEPTYPIPNLERYIHDYLEPMLRSMPRGIGCELEPIIEGSALRLTLLSPSRAEEHAFDLGWDGTRAVVTRHVVRLAERAAPTDLLESGEIRAAGETIPRLIHNLRHYHGGR